MCESGYVCMRVGECGYVCEGMSMCMYICEWVCESWYGRVRVDVRECVYLCVCE